MTIDRDGKRMTRSFMLILGAVAASPAAAAPLMPSATERVDALAERVVDAALDADPTIPFYIDIDAGNHRGWPDRSPRGLRRAEAVNDALHAELQAIGRSEKLSDATEITFALIEDRLETERRLRVCRAELWMGVSHIDGWHLGLVQIAEKIPVETAGQRAEAVQLWSALPAFVDQEITNLKMGVTKGYTSPKRIVSRVLQQLAGLTGGAVEASPLYSPAKRGKDPAFTARFRTILADRVMPALRRYHAFLAGDYLAKARDTLAVSALPGGKACYDASLRSHTTFDIPATRVHAIGTAEVDRNIARVAEIGTKHFGTGDFDAIVRKLATAPDNHFATEEALVAFSRDVVDRAREKSRTLFFTLPDQPMRVEPFQDYMRGTGASSFYEMEPDRAKPAYYRIGSENWATETRGSAEITAVHEGYPGHHMQIAFARGLTLPRIAKLGFNGAFVEGWARYAETLAEEAQIYATDYALVGRRAWAARGMVADPGLHVMGWSRERTAAYLASTGRISAAEAEELVDRMAILPGQLTAYDTGGLEIMALRHRAEAALGHRFDIRGFHQTVLERGPVPLSVLEKRISQWIVEQGGKGPANE